MNHRIGRLRVGMLALGLLFAVPATAAHYESCAFNTGSNATLVLQASIEVDVAGALLDVGDEVAAYTSDGICAGVGVWEGETLAFAVWGDDVATPEKDGFLVGEPLSFRIWDASEAVELGAPMTSVEVTYSDAQPHYTAHGRYVENGIIVIGSLRFVRDASAEEFGKAVSTENQLPNDDTVTLAQNFPNPFNPSTTISYTLSRSTQVRLQVMNVLGQTVRTLVNEHQAAGSHSVSINMDDLPSGLYLYQVQTPDASVTRTMMLSK